MAYYSNTIAADGSVLIATLERRKDSNNWQGTFFIKGGGGNNFGGGTVILQASPDGGTTKCALKDFNGTAISSTAAAVWNSQPFGNTNRNDKNITIYATTTGSTNPSIIVELFDNR